MRDRAVSAQFGLKQWVANEREDGAVPVISGTFHLGMGETFDLSKSDVMPAGTFGYYGECMLHYAWARGETVLQLMHRTVDDHVR